jgi:hypothetical protein
VDDHRAALYVVRRAARIDGVRALSCAASRCVRDRCPRVRRHSACEVVHAGVARAARSHVDVDAARVRRAEVRAAIARRVDASQNVLECLVCAHCRHRTDRAHHRECAGVAEVRHEARSCQRLSQRHCRHQRQEDDLHHGGGGRAVGRARSRFTRSSANLRESPRIKQALLLSLRATVNSLY